MGRRDPVIPIAHGHLFVSGFRGNTFKRFEGCTHYETLTRREREVFSGMVTDLLSKQVAHELGISEITVKFTVVRSCRR